MDGKLRNMTSIYLLKDGKILLLYRQGGRVVNDVWTGSAGGHFEEYELNDAQACVLREMKEELGIDEENIEKADLHLKCMLEFQTERKLNLYKCLKDKETHCGIFRFESDAVGYIL